MSVTDLRSEKACLEKARFGSSVNHPALGAQVLAKEELLGLPLLWLESGTACCFCSRKIFGGAANVAERRGLLAASSSQGLLSGVELFSLAYKSDQVARA